MNLATSTYSLHGLRVRSDLSLDEPAVADGPIDVDIRQGEQRLITDEAPSGELLVRLNLDGRLWYAASRVDDGYLLRFANNCDFALSEDCSSITWHSHEGIDRGLLGIMVKGTVLAFVLSLLGHLVLHASAIAISGRAVAFAGLSGMGKSTAAALLCAGGARLISDDALRVEFGSPTVCFQGASSLRLHQSAASVLDLFEIPPRVAETADGRLAVYPLTAGDTPLGAIAVPYPDRAISEVAVEPIRGADAVWMMSRFGRVVGWQQNEMVRRQFSASADLVREVVVLRARIPWRKPFTRKTIASLQIEIDRNLS